MKKSIALATAAALFATPAMAETVKLGVLLGFTGPIESLNARYGGWCRNGDGRSIKKWQIHGWFDESSRCVVTQLVLMPPLPQRLQNG